MNLNVLRYALEVEKSRSITGAAKQLFISQPNLSRDIKELEEEIGFSIFTRSSRGVVPTEKGREFLQLAKKAVRQYQALEHYCAQEEKDMLSLTVCVPSSTHIASSFSGFLAKYAKGRRLQVNYHELEAMDAIRQTSMRSCNFSIIRYPDRYEKTLLPLLKLKELSCEVLCRHELVVLMSQRHPLAGTSVLTGEMLEAYPEIVYEDTSLASWLHEAPEEAHNESCIHLHEPSLQYEILSHVPGTFLFAVPLPDSALEKYRLVQKKLPGTPRKMTDLLIRPEDYRLSRMEEAFLEMVKLSFGQ